MDLANTYHRLICVVPMIGSGTRTDPRRPAYAPVPDPAGKPLSRSGIIGFGFLASDDKKFAIVEFVAADPAAFKPILADRSVMAYEKGKAKRADIEAHLQQFKKDFNVTQLRVFVP